MRPAQRGFALLIVLWTLVLVTLLVTGLVSAGRGETQLAFNLRQAAQLEAAADGAVNQAIFHLLDRGPARWVAGGAAHKLALDAGAASVRIIDEGGRVNPSNATPALLQALLRGVGVDAAAAKDLAAAIVEWRTPYGQQDLRLARFDRYRAAGRSFGPSGAPFLSLDEVAAVFGMTPELMRRLAPHLTLFTDTDPDPAAADPIVRAALVSAAGGVLPRSTGSDQLRVLRIVASVVGTASGAFNRSAVVRLSMGTDADDVRILAWTAPAS